MSTISLELDDEFINGYYKLLGKNPPNTETLKLSDLKLVLSELQSAMTILNALKESPTSIPTYTEDEQTALTTASGKKSVLIVDDLGVITYQLNLIFQRKGFISVTSQEIFDALEKFKNNHFDLVVMDLFIPTEREGLMLLNELQKITKIKNQKTKIGIISASNKKDHKKSCLERGAMFFIEKTDGWQELLAQQADFNEDTHTDENENNTNNQE